jgi:formylglycine-generating enzyme required for sulfatase activity
VYGRFDDIAWHVDNCGRARLDSAKIWVEDRENYSTRVSENGNMPHEVGQKLPNAFGLYDMIGNVIEWVNDWYDEKYYQNSPPQDPPGPASGGERVLRGGAWDLIVWFDRVSARFPLVPESSYSDIGMRCVWEPD